MTNTIQTIGGIIAITLIILAMLTAFITLAAMLDTEDLSRSPAELAEVRR